MDCSSFNETGFCKFDICCDKSHTELHLPRCLILYHIYPDPKIFNLFINQENQINISNENFILFDDFYLDIYVRMSQYGKVDNILISGDSSLSLTGNAYILFHEVDHAFIAYKHLLGRCFYAGRKIRVELSQISQLSRLKCPNFEKEGICQIDNCSYIHPIMPSPQIYSKCFPSKTIIHPNKLLPSNLQKNEENIQIQHYYFIQ